MTLTVPMHYSGSEITICQISLGSITNNARGDGHEHAYYEKFPSLGDGITIGHTAEVFTNAFEGHIIDGSNIYRYL